MTKQAFPNVEPIRPGYDWQTRIVLAQAYWDAEGLADDRLVGHVRSSRPGALLAVADTGNGTLLREDPRTLVMTLGAADTLKLAGSTIAVFDFVSVDDAGGQRPLDGQWTWPVLPTVTRNIGGTLPAPDPLFSGRSGTLVAIFEWTAPHSVVEWSPVVVPGPHGEGFHVVDASAELTAGFGRDGDTAIIRTTGAEWRKTAGVWAATGKNFWGDLPQQGAAWVELARRWAEEAIGVPVVPGSYSAMHWADQAHYWATRPEILTVSTNIAGVNLAAANMAAILDAPAQAAAAAASAADALTYSSQALGYKDQAQSIAVAFGDLASAMIAINTARDLSQAWAISPTDVTPGNPSAKTSAAAAAAKAAQTALDLAGTTAAAASAVSVRFTPNAIAGRSTANVVLASGLVNGGALNGLTIATGKFYFLGSQTDPKENGIYTAVASGAASRSTFADSAAKLAHIGFVVQAGTVGTGERWTLDLDAAGITLGTTALNFSPVGIEPGYAAEVSSARGGLASLSARLAAERKFGTYVLTAQSITVNWQAKTIVTNAQTGFVAHADGYTSIGASQNVSFTAASATAIAWLYADKTSGVLGIVQAASLPPLNAIIIAAFFNRVMHAPSGGAIAYVDDAGMSQRNTGVPLVTGDYLPGQTLTIDFVSGLLTTSAVAGVVAFDGDFSVTVPASQSVSIDVTNPGYLRWLVCNKLTYAFSIVKSTLGTSQKPSASIHALVGILYLEKLYVFRDYGNVSFIDSSGAFHGGFAETRQRILLPPKLHLFADLPRRLYKGSMLSASEPALLAGMECNLRTAKSGDIDTDRGFTRDILLTPAELGATIELGFRHETQPDKRYIKSMAVQSAVAGALTGKTVNILQIADSIGEDGMMTEIKAALLAKGATAVNAIGTYQSAITDTLLGEARGFWSFRKFIGKDNYSTGIGAHTRSTGGATSTKFQNPFLKLADATDKANHPDWCFRFTGVLNELSYTDDPDKTGNFYIFDFADYLSVHGLSSPNCIMIALERNDLDLDRTLYTNAQRLAFMRLGLNIMLTQMRVWNGTVPIIIVPAYARSSTTAGNARWSGETGDWLENCITDVVARADANIHICGAWPTMSRDWVFPYSASASISAVNDEKVKTITDTVHPDAASAPYYGLRQAAYSVAATLACVL